MNAPRWPITQAKELLEEMPSGVMVMDRDFQIVDHNRAFVDVYGPSVEKPCYQVYKDRGTPCPDCPAQETFADGRPRVLEETGLDRNGQTIHYLARVVPLRDEAGDITHVAAITTDLTATKRLQREYDKRNYIEKYIPHFGIALQEILDLSDRERDKTVGTLEDVLHRSRKF